MNIRPLIVVSSSTAWVDPSVQVHVSECSHGLARWYDPQWSPAGPFHSETQAVTVSSEIAQRIGAIDVTWCDCAIFRAGVAS